MGRASGWLRLEVQHVVTTGQLASHGCPHALCPKLIWLLLVPQSGDPSSSPPKSTGSGDRLPEFKSLLLTSFVKRVPTLLGL